MNGIRSDQPTRPPKRGRAKRPRPAERVEGAGLVTAVVRPVWLLVKCLLPVVILSALAAAILYVRLANGPISLAFLAGPISRSIAAELPGVAVLIEDTQVHLTTAGALEFRMRNVRFNDADGAPMAIAPLAAVGMSTRALWSGRLAPEKVVLIEPRMLVVYSETTGLSLSFSKSPADSAAAATAGSSTVAAAPPDDANVSQQIDLGRLIAETGQRARRGSDAAAYLSEIGVRNATIFLDRSGQQTVWTVVEGKVELEHKKRRSTVTGNLSVASTTGPWNLAFKIEEVEKASSVVLEASLRDLVPRGMSTLVPELALLELIDAPTSGQARIDLKPDGGVIGAVLQLDVGRGALAIAGADAPPMDIESGQLNVRYDAAGRQILVEPSTLNWSQGRVKVGGVIRAAEQSGGKPHWLIDLKSIEGQLAGGEYGGVPVSLAEASLQGRLEPEAGRLAITQARLRAGGALVEATGEVVTLTGRQSVRVEGRIGPAAGEVVKTLWPRFLAPSARSWIGRQMTKGRITGGSFKVVTGGAGSDAAATSADRRLSLTLEVADVAVAPARGIAPIETPRVLVRIEGEAMEVTLPDTAVTQVSPGRRLTLKGGRFTAVDLFGDRVPGEIAFRVQGPLVAAVDFLEQERLGIGQLGLPGDGLDGKIDGQFKIGLPLTSKLETSDIKIDGRVKITDGRAKQVIGPHDVQSATITVDVGDGSVNASGQMLVGGVGAKLSFQRIFGAADDRQPPLRLTANLDAADRTQLGLDINHVVSGDIPVDVTVTRGAKSEELVRVRADLTGTELNIEPIAWRKAPGRLAILEFEVQRGAKGTRSELQNFKVVGDDIAIDGAMTLDAKGRLSEFQFPNFALTLVSRVDLQGTLRNDQIWDIKAKGQYWDGRDFFKRLFAVGQAPDRAVPAKKDQAGVDLKAEFETIQGHGDIALKGLRLQMSRRGDKLTALLARGNVEGGKPIEVALQQTAADPRKLVVQTDDAGQAFRMIGFYPNMQGGEMRLDVNLDGKGAAEKTGMLDVRRFAILGDPILTEVLQTSGGDITREGSASTSSPRRRGKVERERIDFTEMQLPFSVGYNQFVLEKDSQLRGPLLGVLLRGKVDFKTQHLDVVGTYSPLQGVNSLPGVIPGAGQVLAGSRGEGVVGITFWASGPISKPEVLVNPLSAILPGAFRGLAELGPTNFRVIPRDEKPAVEKPKAKLPQAPGAGQSYRQGGTTGATKAPEPDISSSWSTGVETRKKAPAP